MLETHSLTGRQRARHGVGVVRLYTDDADIRSQLLDVDGDTGDQAAAADRHEDRMQVAGVLLENLETDRSLAGDHIGVVVGVHEA